MLYYKMTPDHCSFEIELYSVMWVRPSHALTVVLRESFYYEAQLTKKTFQKRMKLT